ncbi:hypothetical protein B9J78_01730 [bacterium Unc6]|nr:hypothetical protein [bacterium Unc6]
MVPKEEINTKYYKSFEVYLNDLASNLPAPGGGSASALTGAIGCACLSMSANLTLGKEKYKDVEEDIKLFLNITESCRKKLMELVDEDVLVYKKIRQAWKIPKKDPNRYEKIQDALKSATSVPFEICKTCFRSIKMCEELAQKCNKNLISDVGVGVLLLESAYRSAVLNVQINLSSIKDEVFIQCAKNELEVITKEIEKTSKNTLDIVKNKMTANRKNGGK